KPGAPPGIISSATPVRISRDRRTTAMRCRSLALGVTAALLMTSGTLALAQSAPAKKPLGKMTCDDFLAIDESFKPKVVYWAAAYGKGGKPEAAVLDVEGTDKLVPAL